MADVLGWQPWALERLRADELAAGEAYLRAREEVIANG
jgi:hypothetical protein